MSERRTAKEARPVTESRASAKAGPSAVRTLAGWRRILATVAGLLFVASVVKELRTPREQRTWHGVVLGFVPYELRRPTLQRVQERLWNPASHRLFTSRVFGVGWSLNVHEAWMRLRAVVGAVAPTGSAPSVA